MKETDISKKVRERVYERDSVEGAPNCIICGRPYPHIHHIVERSRGGKGIEENLVCLCYRCHSILHDTEDPSMKEAIKAYMRKCYPDWDERGLV